MKGEAADSLEPLMEKVPESQGEEEEEMETGKVALSVYLTYLRALSPLGIALSLVTLVLAYTCSAGADWWVSVWTDSDYRDTTDTTMAVSDITTAVSDTKAAINTTMRATNEYLTDLAIYGSLGLLQSTCFSTGTCSIES